MNEHNAFDLAKFITDPATKQSRWSDKTTDLSGRPKPKDVRVQLDSKVIVNCDVRYDGRDQDGTRRFVVLAEIDWENYRPMVLIVGEYPRDVTLIFRVPGVPDAECDDIASRLHLVPEKVIEV